MQASIAEDSPEENQPETEQSPSNSPAPLSKKAQKKAARQARFAEQKSERRAKEKQAKKEKKRIRAQKRDAGELEDDEAEAEEEKRRMMKRAKTGDGQKPFGATICVDLGFDDMMTDKEIISLTSQLAYTYSANRRSIRPFETLLYTSLNARTLTRMDAANDASYKRWSNTEWWEESYDGLWSDEQVDDVEDKVEERKRTRAPKESVIYLTADSEHELLELREGETYIIGGICDHNRYKNLCLNKAEEGGIRTARLPIGRYLANLTTRKVLTVNHVMEILLKWVETRNWEEALYAVIPKRKFGEKGSKTMGDDQSSAEAEVGKDVGESGLAATTVEGTKDESEDVNGAVS